MVPCDENAIEFGILRTSDVGSGAREVSGPDGGIELKGEEMEGGGFDGQTEFIPEGLF